MLIIIKINLILIFIYTNNFYKYKNYLNTNHKYNFDQKITHKRHPKYTQNKDSYSDLVQTYFRKSPDIAISLSYSLVLAGSLGALGRRFESCRPDHLKPSHTRKFPRLSFFIANYKKNKT